MLSNINTHLNPLTKVRKNNKIVPLNINITYSLNFDGASKGNPGLSGAGMVIYKNKEEIWSSCKFLGKKTNNQSEYSALILGLKGAIELKITRLTVLGDSLLVINQVNGLFKVRSEMISELYEEVCLLKSQFEFIEFHHVYREYNKRADELSNLALQDLQNEKTCFEIHELDEDWIEEIKLDELTSNKKSLFVKIPSDIKSKNKQLSITEFFKVNSLFPNIS